MNKKQVMNQLNSQKGMTGADVILALLIILATVGVIGMVYSNLVIGSRGVDRKAGATRIATNILENMSQIYYDEMKEHLDTLSNQGTVLKDGANYTIVGNAAEKMKIFNTTIPNGYRVKINLQNSYGGETSGYDLVKKATIDVTYKVNNQDQTVQLSKVFERETIRECNSPNFSEEYIKQMLPSGENYELYSATSKDAAGVKIICPVQYDKASQTYKVVTDTKKLWYSYANKQWAQVLILDPAQVQETISPETFENFKNENSYYIWIPRFALENGKEPSDGIYFNYKATDYVIENSYGEGERFIYHYIKHEDRAWSGRVAFEKGLVGKWCSYSELSDETSLAGILNQSQYGPMMEY